MQTSKDPLAMLKPGYGDRPPLPRYESEPVTYIETLNDADAIATPLELAFERLNQRVAGNAYRIYEN